MGLGSFFLEIGVDTAALQRGLNSAESRITSFSGKLESVGTKLSIAVSAPLALVGRSSIKAAADFETLEVSFGTMLKSMDKGRDLMKDLQKYNLDTPFQSAEVNNAAKSLLAFGFAQNQIIPQMKMIGDLSAGIGIPIKDLADIYGKARVQGRLFAEDINQLTGRGIPIIAEFAKQFGVSEQAIKKMTEDGKISFANLEKAFESMTSKGGQFYNMTANQSKTLAGIYSNFQDSVAQNLKVVGDSIVKNLDLKTIVPQASKLLGDMAKAFSELSPQAQKAIVIIGGIAVVLPPLLALAGTVLPAIATGFAAIISPAGLAATALVGAAVLIATNWDKVSDSIYRAQSRLQKGMFELGMAGANIQEQFDQKGANEMRASLLKSYGLNKAEDPRVGRFTEQAKKDYQANKKFNYKRGEKPKPETTPPPPPPPPPPALGGATSAEIEAAKKITEETLSLRKDLQSQTRDLIIASMESETQRAKSEAQKRAEDEINAMREKMVGLKDLETEFAEWRKGKELSLANELVKIQRESFKVPMEIKRQMIADVMESVEPKDKKKLTTDKMQNSLDRTMMLGAKDIQSNSDRMSVGNALGMDIDFEKWKTDSASYIEAAEGMVQANARIKNSTSEIALAAGLAMGETVAQMMMGTATITDLAKNLLSSVGSMFADMLKQMAVAEAKALGLKALLGDPTALVRVIGLAAAGGLVGAFSNKVGQGKANNQQQRQNNQPAYSVTRGSNIYTANTQYQTIKNF